METIAAFHLASKSRGLPGFVQPLVEHMREARDESDLDPVSMRGCKYVVWGYQETSGWKVVTIEKIWESVGAERLRDMCLSYAFFKLILRSYDKVPLLSREIFYPLSKLVKLSRAGQYGEFCSVALSSEVKQAIVASLLPHVQDEALPLSRGTATITRHQLSEAISRSCEWETDAQVILVWHIATSFCELFQPAKNTDDPDHEHFLVATQLSKYCAHLVCFAPELLPGRQYTTELDFDTAVKQARYNMDSRVKGLDMRQRYQNMIQMNYPHGKNTNIAIESAALAKALMEQVIASPGLGWRVLAEFWAELLLFLAPSDNADAHGEYLARGGEFITHIWALLNHAGIVER
ncbi:hypothetical protein V2J09_005473 [Rumex salicifolius]